MQFTLSKKTWFVFAAVVISISTLFFSCQKELSSSGIDLGTEAPDLTTKIASSVSGFVTDENEVAVDGATVVFGSSTTTTDKFGYFEVRNVQVCKNAAFVSVIKPGYFKGIKTYIATANKSAFFRIKLLPKSTAGNIDAAAGGLVALSNGLSVTLPAGAVVNATNNTAYSGPVTVAAQWLNPAATDTWRTMPGDLRGLDDNGSLKLLQTYGMSAIELTGSSGELLQIAAGKKATLNFPLPNAVAASAPTSIPLWYFDETNGLWKQEGSAVKSGNNYVGEVSHFSYWNCDMPIDQSVQFSCTIVDGSGNPMPNISVWIEYANGGYTGAHGYTDSTGYINGLLPANAQLVLQVYTDYQCTGPTYTQQITSGATELSLGNITVPPTATATISGNVKDCNNAPLTNGYVVVQYGYNNQRVTVNADGTFNFNTLVCASSNTSVTIFAVDNANHQQGNTVTYLLVGGDNTVGTLNACGNSIEEFINYSIDNINYSFVYPADSMLYSIRGLGNSQFIISSNRDSTAYIQFAFSEITSNAKLGSFVSPQINTPVLLNSDPITVNFTEIGAVGEFLAGNFAGIINEAATGNLPFNVTCTFRVRRTE